MLAMVVNDDAGCLNARVAWAIFASKLAPTGDRGHLQKSRSAVRPPSLAGQPTGFVNGITPCRSEHARDGRQR